MTFLKKNLPFLLLLLILGGVYYWYKTPKFGAGSLAPDFTSTTIDGDPFQFSELEGNIILLSFWGSWCGPCRAESKHLVSIYDKYHKASFKNADGFTIVSVGMETKKNYWLNAIKSDGLIWPHHVSDLKRMESAAGSLYGVWEIPTSYLIDEKGVILGANLTPKQTESFLDARLAN